MKDMSHLDIACASVSCFADDGTLDLRELDHLLALALRDGTVNDDEKRVLSGIFRQVRRADVSAAVWRRIEVTKKRHGIE